MSVKVTIYGASDDLVEVTGIPGADEFSTNGNWTGVLEAPDGSTAMVYVDFRDNGTWTVAVGQYDEEYKLDAFKLTTTVDFDLCRYSTVGIIDVPDGTIIREVSD